MSMKAPNGELGPHLCETNCCLMLISSFLLLIRMSGELAGVEAALRVRGREARAPIFVLNGVGDSRHGCVRFHISQTENMKCDSRHFTFHTIVSLSARLSLAVGCVTQERSQK